MGRRGGGVLLSCTRARRIFEAVRGNGLSLCRLSHLTGLCLHSDDGQLAADLLIVARDFLSVQRCVLQRSLAPRRLLQACLLVSYRPLARLSHFLLERRRRATIVPTRGGIWSLISTQAQKVDAETL